MSENVTPKAQKINGLVRKMSNGNEIFAAMLGYERGGGYFFRFKNAALKTETDLIVSAEALGTVRSLADELSGPTTHSLMLDVIKSFAEENDKLREKDWVQSAPRDISGEGAVPDGVAGCIAEVKDSEQAP